MASITALNVLYIASSASKQARLVSQSDTDGAEATVMAAVRTRGKEGDAEHTLDQTLFKYRIESEKKFVCSEDSSTKFNARRKESRK